MPSVVRNGPFVLPSGRAVQVIPIGSVDRPWDAESIGNGTFVIRRQKRGDSSRTQYFNDGGMAVATFTQEDAEALVLIMNAKVRGRATSRGDSASA